MSVSIETSFAEAQKKIKNDPDQFGLLVDQFIAQARSKKELRAFVRLYEQGAKARAAAYLSKWKQGDYGRLAGLVVGLKDLFCYKDHPVTAASKILNGFVAPYNATVVQRLLEADGLILGHQNCDAFGMGSATKYSIYGPTRNAQDPSRSAGGSSGGSAVAVQARMCHVSLGTDTGGSVRQPAAHCGVVGLKPTYGRISRYGVIAYASSLDTVGILAQSVTDCAAVLQVVAGHDPKDTTSSLEPVPDYRAKMRAYLSQKALTKAWRIAYLPETLSHQALQPEIQHQVTEALSYLKSVGHSVQEASFPLLDQVLPTYYVLTTSEASSNLARYDGVRYGYRAPGFEGQPLVDMIRQTRSEGFGPEVKRRILLGAYVLSADYYDAYYIQAQRVRQKIKKSLEDILEKNNFIILPTTPTTAPKQTAHETETDPIKSYLADLYTTPAPIAGLPALSIPLGKDKKGLPIGIQIIGRAFKEAELLAFARYLQQIYIKNA